MGLLRVDIPIHFYVEISYTINCLLGEFLGLKYAISKKDIQDVKIVSESGTLTIKNHFFRNLKEINSYKSFVLPSSVIDNNIKVDGNSFPLVTLFGENSILDLDGETVLGSDVIAGTFFMLTRWEECINLERDIHDRFPASASIAYKFGFLDRAIVNEYIELLWALLVKVGCKQKRKVSTYRLVPTHDVDRPFLFNTFVQNMKLLGGLIKKYEFLRSVELIKYAIKREDPWNTYDFFMDLSERENVKAHFFFLSKGESKYDGNFDLTDLRLKKVYDRIKVRGHIIGFHPSYNSYNDIELFKKEKLALEEAVGATVSAGRQHYLRYSAPITSKIWDDSDMVWDSTLGYADCSGFRCGVCYPFPVFDFINRKQLNLYERPLIVMESSLVGYGDLRQADAIKRIRLLKSEVKKYYGEFVFLYHNSSFFVNQYRDVSNELLSELYN